MMSHTTDQPAVGYKSPPLHSRFQKGRSGNPSGRRKATREMGQNDLDAVMSQQVNIVVDGKRVKVTARQALYQKLLAMAFNDNLRALAMLLKADSLNDNSTGQVDALGAAEAQAIIADFARRQGSMGGGDA
jgi:hypothetical protein